MERIAANVGAKFAVDELRPDPREPGPSCSLAAGIEESLMAKDASRIEESIDVQVPLRVAYNQWTQFEEFPKFMEGVEYVHQVTDQTLRWSAQIGGKQVEWKARITEQLPDRRISWQSTTGAPNSGTVSFERLTERSTRITLQLEYQPAGLVENVGDFFGFVNRRAKGDLERFRTFVESRGAETGGWRGEIPSAGAPPTPGRPL
jgi:uncharacterized membrane protein